MNRICLTACSILTIRYVYFSKSSMLVINMCIVSVCMWVPTWLYIDLMPVLHWNDVHTKLISYFYKFVQGSDYRTQFQMGNGALLGASYIQVSSVICL